MNAPKNHNVLVIHATDAEINAIPKKIKAVIKDRAWSTYVRQFSDAFLHRFEKYNISPRVVAAYLLQQMNKRDQYLLAVANNHQNKKRTQDEKSEYYYKRAFLRMRKFMRKKNRAIKNKSDEFLRGAFEYYKTSKSDCNDISFEDFIQIGADTIPALQETIYDRQFTTRVSCAVYLSYDSTYLGQIIFSAEERKNDTDDNDTNDDGNSDSDDDDNFVEKNLVHQSTSGNCELTFIGIRMSLIIMMARNNGCTRRRYRIAESLVAAAETLAEKHKCRLLRFRQPIGKMRTTLEKFGATCSEDCGWERGEMYFGKPFDDSEQRSTRGDHFYLDMDKKPDIFIMS
jgi:hypothetical protein